MVDRRLADYFELRLHELTLSAFCRLMRQLIAQAATAGDKLRNLSSDLNRLIEHYSATAADVAQTDERGKALRRLAAEQIAARRSDLLAEMELRWRANCRAATTDVREVRAVLAAAVLRTARASALRTLREYAAETTAAVLQGGGGDPLFAIDAALKEAAPRRFANCGGQQRLLVVASEGLAPSITPAALGDATTASPTVVADSHSDMLVCYEVQDLPLKRIAAAVLDQRYQAVEAASRLHTRSDVAWTPL